MRVRQSLCCDAAKLRPLGVTATVLTPVLTRALFVMGLLLAVVQPLHAGDAEAHAPADPHDREVRQAIKTLQTAGVYMFDGAGKSTSVMIRRKVDRPTLGLLAKLDRVAYLALAGDWVTDARLEELPALPHLETLAIRSHAVGDRGLNVIGRRQSLKSLSLSQLRISDEGLELLAGLPALENLEVDHTPITGAGLMHLRGRAKLRSLVLEANQLQDAELAHLGNMPGLTTLELHDPGISDAAVPYLKWASGLKQVALQRTRITDAGINDLRHSLASADIIGGSLGLGQEKLGRIGLALHNYHAKYGHFPPAVLTGPDGKTPHSWRVALLPFLGVGSLLAEYHLDQPWDSPANRKVLDRMPAVYRGPKAAANSNVTSYLAVTGQGTAFADKGGTTIRQLKDGTSNVVMLVEAKSDIPWTKPEDLSRKSPTLPKLEPLDEDGFNALMADGAPRYFRLPFRNEKDLGELLNQSALVLYEDEVRRRMMGNPAPEFTLKDLQGKDVALAPTIAGKVAVIVFTAVNCPPCRVEALHLAELFRKHRDEGLVVLAVNPQNEPADLVRQCAEKEKTPYPTLLDGLTVARDDYHILASPMTYFVSRAGIVVGMHIGFKPGDERSFESETAELLNGLAPSKP
jgi:peroxiredoxin